MAFDWYQNLDLEWSWTA